MYANNVKMLKVILRHYKNILEFHKNKRTIKQHYSCMHCQMAMHDGNAEFIVL